MRSLVKTAVVLFGLVCLEFCAGGRFAARAAIPGTDNPKAFTRHDYLKAELEQERRWFVGGYQTVGKHDPKWDELALKFLDGIAVYETYAQEAAVYHVVRPPTLEQLRQ